MYKPSEQGLRLLELLKTGDIPLGGRVNRRVAFSPYDRTFYVSEGYATSGGQWCHQRQVGRSWPSNLVEALMRAKLIDTNGYIRPHGSTVRADEARPQEDTDTAGQHQIDGAVRTLLELWRIPYVPIPAASPKDRQLIIGAILDREGFKR